MTEPQKQALGAEWNRLQQSMSETVSFMESPEYRALSTEMRCSVVYQADAMGAYSHYLSQRMKKAGLL